MPDIFNPQIDKITEREVVYDFISRISFGRSHNIGEIYSTYINQDSSALVTASNQNQSQIEYTLSGTKLVDYLISISLMPPTLLYTCLQASSALLTRNNKPLKKYQDTAELKQVS